LGYSINLRRDPRGIKIKERRIGFFDNLYKESAATPVRIFVEELTVQPQERKKQETVLQQKKKGEEEKQDHEFALCFDIFLQLNIIFQYHENICFM
jgi:hypothetical protein